MGLRMSRMEDGEGSRPARYGGPRNIHNTNLDPVKMQADRRGEERRGED